MSKGKTTARCPKCRWRCRRQRPETRCPNCGTLVSVVKVRAAALIAAKESKQ